MSTKAKADDTVVDEVSITVPVSCTLSGTGMASHTDSIPNGTYRSEIGSTTLKAYCNDAEGFAIYANGYTDNEDGKNVLASSSLGSSHDIATGTATSGDTSAWAMKLTKVSDSGDTTTTQFTIDNSFDSYHIVPTDFTKIAHKDSSTSMDTTAGGVSLNATYASYISPTQSAGTYNGQVKYVLVHPSTAGAPVSAGKVAVNYLANGSSFPGGTTTNRVVYATSPMYIGTTATIAKSPNVNDDGTQNEAYYTGDEINTLEPITLTGADKIKVVLRYGLTANSGEVLIAEGDWDGDITEVYYDLYSDSENLSGTNTYVFNGDTITIAMWAGDTPETGHDYGYYAQVYPIYSTEQEGTVETNDFVSLATDTGAYANTTDWYGSWYADINGAHYDFLDETEVKTFLESNIATLSVSNIDLYRGLTFDEAYTRANKTKDNGNYKQQELTKSMCNTIAITQNETLKDIRDNNTYLVGKLKDGNCWMLDNLALDPTDSTTASNMNASNTNATNEAIQNYLNGGSSNTGWSSVAVKTSSTGWGHSNSSAWIEPWINNASKDTTVTSYGAGSGKVGIYYNYCAATVGTYCYADGSGVDLPDTIIDAPQDVCPANWRMPTGGSTGEYAMLAQKYATTTDATNSASLQYSLSAPLSGVFYDFYVSALNQGSYGYWWSSTYYDGYGMYDLGVTPTGVISVSVLDDRRIGQSIRCLMAG